MRGYEDENGDSRRAQRILESAGLADVTSEMVLVQARGGGVTADDPEIRSTVAEVRAAVEGTGQAEHVRTPYDASDPAPVSADRTAALVLFQISGSEEQAVDRVEPVLDAVAGVQARHPDLRIEQAGAASVANLVGTTIGADFQRAEQLSLPITAVILLIAFGTLLPMLIPILLSMTAFFAATGLLAVTSHLVHVSEATTNLMLLVGLAVGVDYSLFYLRREREERANGRSRQQALEIAAATAGRAVLISGITVIVAMAGMFLTGNGVFMGFAEGTILVVLAAVVGSVTVLPAVLSTFGGAVEARLVHGIVRAVTRGRVTWRRRLGVGTGGGRVWNSVLSGVLRRPLLAVVLAAGALVALAVPAFGMKTSQPGIEDLQGDFAITDTIERIEQAFPGGTDPASVVVTAADVTSTEVRAAIERFRTEAFAKGYATEPFGVQVNPDATVANISVGIPGQGPQDERSRTAVEALRESLIPQTLGQVPGTEAYVTGAVAGTIDFNRQLARTVPVVFAFVLLLAFVLMLASFRSVVVAVMSIVLNLLSVAAAYGVLVLVFQDGHGERVLGFTSAGVIVNWLPLFLFVILFGLSMDYQVFILSRIREARDSGMPTDQAIAHGIRSTAGVVTSAALIMVGVFSVFANLSLLSFKQMGIGLAAAIFLDATVVRAVLLPATMKLLGERNWYLPRWLRWLPATPQVRAEQAEQPDGVPVETPIGTPVPVARGVG